MVERRNSAVFGFSTIWGSRFLSARFERAFFGFLYSCEHSCGAGEAEDLHLLEHHLGKCDGREEEDGEDEADSIGRKSATFRKI